MLSAIDLALANRGFSSRAPQSLFEPIDYTLSLGGKRLRPLLALLAAHLIGEDWQEAIPVATAIEIFHNFTLLHDDLMDRSPMRRGKPTVYCRWSDNTAILSGDAMSIESYKALEGITNPERLMRILPRFNTVAMDVCRGQQYDMEFEGCNDVEVDEYLEMIRLKTSVLIGLALELGVRSVSDDEALASQFYEIGECLGLAFQIQDDLLDVYGDEETFGKPVGTDIMNAKKTLLLLYTQANISPSQRVELDRLMKLPNTDKEERISGVRFLYEAVNVRDYAEGLIKNYTSRALELLDMIDASRGRSRELRELFLALMHRNN